MQQAKLYYLFPTVIWNTFPIAVILPTYEFLPRSGGYFAIYMFLMLNDALHSCIMYNTNTFRTEQDNIYREQCILDLILIVV